VILDSSAIVAVVLRAPGWERVLETLATAPACAIGAPTLAETTIVLTAKMGTPARTVVSRLLQELGAVVIPFGDEHWRAAVDAYTRFGKGRHKAALNFGDCLTYAIARLADQPLLFVGDDFRKTDIAAAI